MPSSARSQETLRIAAYNIRHGLGMDSVVDLNRIANVLRPLAADVITLQEIDNGTERTDGVDQARRLGELLGQYGMAVLTKLPVLGVANIGLPDGEEPRTALEVRVAVGREGRETSVVGIHF
jgi:endonuclease/exonuclease/phosphatase family metal-dependent hydrolase